MADPVPLTLTPEESRQQERVREAISGTLARYRSAATEYYCMREGFRARAEAASDPDAARHSTNLQPVEEKRLAEARRLMDEAFMAMRADAIDQGERLGVGWDIAASAAWAVADDLSKQNRDKELECPVSSLDRSRQDGPSRPLALAGPLGTAPEV